MKKLDKTSRTGYQVSYTHPAAQKFSLTILHYTYTVSNEKKERKTQKNGIPTRFGRYSVDEFRHSEICWSKKSALPPL